MMFSYSGYEIHLVKNGFKNSAFSLFFFVESLGSLFFPLNISFSHFKLYSKRVKGE